MDRVKEQRQLTTGAFLLTMFLVREHLHRPWALAKAKELEKAPSAPLHFLSIES
jgi:hypothetical protein